MCVCVCTYSIDHPSLAELLVDSPVAATEEEVVQALLALCVCVCVCVIAMSEGWSWELLNHLYTYTHTYIHTHTHTHLMQLEAVGEFALPSSVPLAEKSVCVCVCMYVVDST